MKCSLENAIKCCFFLLKKKKNCERERDPVSKGVDSDIKIPKAYFLFFCLKKKKGGCQ